MEISILVNTNYVSSTGIVEDIAEFVNTPNRIFLEGEELLNENKIYKRSGNDFLAEDYDVGDEPIYLLNEILFKDNKLQFVSEVIGNDVILQPEEYLPPESLAYGTWNNRYAKIGVMNTTTNSWTATTNGITHLLYWNGSEWRYKITKLVDELYWGPEEYQYITENLGYFIRRIDAGGGLGFEVRWVYDDVIVDISIPTIAPTPYVTVILSAIDGERYRCGGLAFQSGTTQYWRIQKELTRQVPAEVADVSIDMLYYSSFEVAEIQAYCINPTNCLNEWVAKTVIRRGDDLYIRSDTYDVIQTKIVNSVAFTELTTLEQANGWGWTYLRPSNVYSPLDNKQYTFVDAPAPIEYIVGGINPFNSIAITGMIASELTVEFLPLDGSPAIPPITMYPNTTRDNANRLPQYKTTLIAYAPRDIIGNVKLTFLNQSKNVRIGGVHLGLSVDAGFTNLVFTNKFKDYSPYERDEFGNVLYIAGVKSNIYSGTVDVQLKNYDMINRLMASIGGETVMLNGSDTTDNLSPDSTGVFSSTMLLGRIRNFSLKTKLERESLSQMATYTFEIEEDV